MPATFNPNHPLNRYRADCRACKPVLLPMPADFACLEHTCPCCGHALDSVYNDRDELVHYCCEGDPSVC